MVATVHYRSMTPGDHDAAVDLGRSLPEFFNDQGIEEMTVDIRNQLGVVAEIRLRSACTPPAAPRPRCLSAIDPSGGNPPPACSAGCPLPQREGDPTRARDALLRSTRAAETLPGLLRRLSPL